MKKNKIIIGKVGAPYGVRGWVKVNAYTDPITNLLNYKNLYIQHQNEWQPAEVEASKPHGTQIAVKFKGIDDRDTAQRFTNDMMAIDREQLETLPEGEYYQNDLIGFSVETQEGVWLGTLVEFMATGANDVIIVETEQKRHLLPYINDVIKHIDPDDKKITVDWDPDF